MSARRRLIALGLAALMMPLAAWVLGRFGASGELATLPGWARSALGGAAAALPLALVLSARHVWLRRDRVGAAYDEVRGGPDNEMRALAARGFELWRQVERAVDDRAPDFEAFEEAALKLLDVARHWQRVDVAGAPTAAATAAERMDVLDERIAATDDEATRRQYQQARAALAKQLRYLRGIDVRRERSVALMHSYLATMEQLRLAMLNVESAGAAAC